jgi:hypothetical protein
MRKFSSLLFSLSVSVLFYATASAQTLSETEAKNLLTGTTIETETSRGNPFTITFDPRGRLDGEIDHHSSGNTFMDSGKWWIKGNGVLCRQFDRFGEGALRCSFIVLDAETKVIRLRRKDGSDVGVVWFIARNGPKAETVIAGRASAKVARAPRTTPASPPATASEKAPSRPRMTGPQGPHKAGRVITSQAAPQDKAPPTIDVPATIAAKSAAVEITGRITDASQIIEVTVNGRPVGVGADGSFKVRRGVPQGESMVAVTALDEWGNSATREIRVTRQAVAMRSPTPSPAQTRAQANPFAGIHFGQYHALVIGNNDYRDLPKLKTAVGDARAVAKVLVEQYGFKTRVLINATRADVIRALAEMRAKLKADDNLLVYYAGHGIVDSVTEQGYWLPVDAEEAVPTNWVSNTDITNMLRAIRAKHIMVVADSCYSGTLVRAAPAKMKTANEREAWVKRMLKKRSRTALVSGGLEPVMDSGGGGHSVFAKAFLTALRENQDVLEGQALFTAIKRPVVTNSDQTPQYSDIRRAGHEGGEFMFVRK